VRSAVNNPLISLGLQLGKDRVLQVELDAFVADEHIFDARAIENEESFRRWSSERL
jgi:hypothetical protein